MSKDINAKIDYIVTGWKIPVSLKGRILSLLGVLTSKEQRRCTIAEVIMKMVEALEAKYGVTNPSLKNSVGKAGKATEPKKDETRDVENVINPPS